MSISFREIFNKLTGHWLLLGFRVAIQPSSSPISQIIITLNVTINQSVIKIIDFKRYIISPAYSQTTTSIVIRPRAINSKGIRKTVTKRIGFSRELRL
jgi:hypothetical protein